jgi:hypothetical protein
LYLCVEGEPPVVMILPGTPASNPSELTPSPGFNAFLAI